MRNLILFDDDSFGRLLPLCYTKPLSELRIGILTIREKWEKWLSAKASYITQDYLAIKYPIHLSEDNWVVNSSYLPSIALCNLIGDLSYDEALLDKGDLVACRLSTDTLLSLIEDQETSDIKGYEISIDLTKINELWDLTKLNDQALKSDYQLITQGRKSAAIPDHVRVTNPANIFIENDVKLGHCTLNAEDGPIYLGKASEIMDGACIRGSFSLGAKSTVKMSAKIYGPTTIGEHSKIGGEVSRSIISSYSNKGHDGYLGDSIIGEWCNLGADTNVSNLKNNYAEVKLWSYQEKKFILSGTQFLGTILGDHSKCGINTMLNTGTVIGISSNVYGAGYPRNFIPSFSWGGSAGYTTYKLEKALEVARIVMARRNKELSEEDKAIFTHIFEVSGQFRS